MHLFAILLIALVLPQSQQPSGLCRARTCGLVVDWGIREADIADLRYGHSSEFAIRIRQHLKDTGYLFTDDVGDVKLKVLLHPEYVWAPCDVVAGTGSSERCRTVGRVRFEFLGEDAGGTRPKDFRVTNRCGNGEFMTVARFGQYTAEMLERALNPGKSMPRPSVECRL
jgi:hypothetical protein